MADSSLNSGWMSWWDRYFAPGDIRATTISNASPSGPAKPQSSDDKPITLPNIASRVNDATRARRMNGMFYGGLAFTIFSAFVTRRALARKHLAVYPKMVKNEKLEVPTFTQSNTAPSGEGGLDALQALSLATLNVSALFMAGIGAFMKFNNVADLEDLRDFVREGIGYDVYAGDTEADKEIEEWMASVLARKDGVGDLKTTIVEKMAELAEIEKKKNASPEEQARHKKALLERLEKE